MKKLAVVFALLLVAVAVLAPILANDVPLVASVGGELAFPAFADYVGAPPPGPGGQDWKVWWARLPEGSEDWALMPPWPYGPLETDPERVRHGPDLEHPLGNDDSGRDVLARLVHGTSTAVGIGLGATVLAMVVGVLLGGLAGYLGGWTDVMVGRVLEVFLCFPVLLFLLAAGAFFGSSTAGVVVVMALVFWTSFARIVRGELLSLRQRDFVLAARGLGVSDCRILLRHLLPLLRGPVLVTAAFCVAQAVVAESTLSFLGLGPGLAASSWGSMLAQGKESAHLGAWHLWLFPGLLLVATITCCHALADRWRS